MTEKLVLKTALGKHAHVKPLRDGRVSSGRVELDFQHYEPLPKAFRLMVRSSDLDLSEMAVVTHLMAHHFGKPLTGMAVPLWSRLPHTNLICPGNSGISGPKDLEGRKVGVRAYGQTSGVWVQGCWKASMGSIWTPSGGRPWRTHLSKYEDPPIAQRNQTGKRLRELMLDGELAAIMGEREVSPEAIRTVVSDAEAAAYAWIGQTGLMPVNHGLFLRTPLHETHAWLAGELMGMFAEARRVAIEEDGASPPPEYGFAANRGSFDLLLEFSARQQITPRRYTPEELFLQL